MDNNSVYKTISNDDLRLMILSASHSILNRAGEVNDMNVFPVPDGDTGTNMSLTFSAAAESVIGLDDGAGAGEMLDTLAKAALRNARGNSGVILSQILRGIKQGLGGSDELDVAAVKRMACSARDTAYRAVMKPTEGTILTVIREIAEFAEQRFPEFEDVREFLKALLGAGEESLKRTPEILPVLKQAGVVDAGGCGVTVLLGGAVTALETGAAVPLEDEVKEGASKAADKEDIDTANIKYSYCTEFLINKSASRSVTQFKASIKPKGDCMLVIDDEEIVKVHIHTNHPGFVIEQALKLGELTNLKIDNMKYQHNEIIGNTIKPESGADEEEEAEPPKKYGFAAVCSGSGMDELFRSLNCDVIVKGGQTMNPSTQELLDAAETVNAENIFILPNNKNIIMAAEQVNGLTEKNVIVIPTRSMPQGITALASFDEDASPEDNEVIMTETSETVKCGQITYAARDSEADGFDITEGDIMGVIEGKVKVCGQDVEKVFFDTAKELVDDECGVISVYYGIDADKDEAKRLTAALEKEYPDLDVSLNYGGQSVYFYIISAE